MDRAGAAPAPPGRGPGASTELASDPYAPARQRSGNLPLKRRLLCQLSYEGLTEPARIELASAVLETAVLPLHQGSIMRPMGVEPTSHGLKARCITALPRTHITRARIELSVSGLTLEPQKSLISSRFCVRSWGRRLSHWTNGRYYSYFNVHRSPVAELNRALERERLPT